jgi:hypothetical protein
MIYGYSLNQKRGTPQMNKRKIVFPLILILAFSLLISLKIYPLFGANNQVSNCDNIINWSAHGGTIELDTADKQEGSSSISFTSTGNAYWLEANCNPTGTWDWSDYEYIQFWLKTNDVNRIMSIYVYDSEGQEARKYGLNSGMDNDVWSEKIIGFTGFNVIPSGFDWSSIDRIVILQYSQYQTGHLFKVDGVQVGPEGVDDIEPPEYSILAHSNTMANQPTEFSCLWSDDVGLSGFVLSTNNTGTWVNSTWMSLGGTSGWSNLTQTISPTAELIQYKFYCNDTSNNWGQTNAKAFIVSHSVTSFPFDDNFDDETTDSSKWVKFEKYLGTVSEINGRVETTVSEPPGAAGYVTKNKIDVNDIDVRIDVSNAHLCEAAFSITLDGTYDHFWYSNDFYCIEKHGHSNETLIKVRTNGGERIVLYQNTWTGPNGSFRIRIQDGYIYFYEEGNMIYTETYRLRSDYCYVHFEANTWSSEYYGIDYFDNFSLSYSHPASSDISVTTSSSSAPSAFEVTIGGKLTQQDSGAGIPNAPVLVSYSYHPDLMSYIPSDKGWTVIGTAVTDANGDYSITWFADSSGYFVVEAFYPGTGGTLGASTSTTILIDNS